MQVAAALSGLALLCACGATEGPLLHVRGSDAGESAPDAARDAGIGAGAITADMPWQYQLVGDVDPSTNAELLVIDLFNTEVALIDGLHAQGKLAVAYVSAGTHEPFRDDADAFPEAAIGNPLASYPDESWLDVRDADVRALMAARLDRARDKGFDGVLPTSLTAYRADSGFTLTAADQRDYTSWLAAEASARGLEVGMSGDFGQVGALGAAFDWAVDFGCIARDDCSALSPFAEAQKPVFDVEVEGEAADVCARAASYGVNAILKRSDFGAYRVGCL